MASFNTNANIRNVSSIRHSEKDVAAEFVSEYAQPVDRAVERQVIRKIDIILMPCMWIGYGLVYYDKVQDDSTNRHQETKMAQADR